MDVKNIPNVEEFLLDSSQYKGEIFVNIKSTTEFEDVKSFVDNNNLIAFISGENAIYAQGHKYTGLTDAQIGAIASITNINSKIAKAVDNNDTNSIIGTLSWGSGENAIDASNVTEFVTAVLTRVEAGDSAIGEELETIGSQINDLEAKLSGIDGTVADELDDINTSITGLGNSINNVLGLLVTGAYATHITKDSNDNFIDVELVQTQNTDPETSAANPYVPPFTYKIKSKNILSSSQIQTLIDNAVAQLVNDAPQAFDTLKEISDWIAAHPEDTAAMNSNIIELQNKVRDLLGSVTITTEDPETHESITEIKKYTTGSLNGQNWATSIEEINNILGNVSFAENVVNGAEPNIINELQFIRQNISTLTGDSNDTSVTFGNTSLNSDKTVELSLDISIFEKIKTHTLSLASTDAQAKATAALNAAKAYTDDKLSWLIM